MLDRLQARPPLALVVDSIQTVWLPESEAYAGSVTQIRDCTQALIEFAKRSGCATFIVGHVTKDGAIAGPRLLEHLVDTVLYFEGDANGEYRILRAYKNRFGSIDEICVFSMHDDGLREVADPSRTLPRNACALGPSGSCVVASVVGSRPLLVEVQALVGETSYGTPRRLANNVDQQRLAMILAVLERRAGLHLGAHDVYASVAGGLRVGEPAADLGIALAIASAFRNVPLPPNLVAFGELGLAGEVRAVNAADRRRAEARKLGFTDDRRAGRGRRRRPGDPQSARIASAAMPLFEIVPNLSEGRDPAFLEAAGGSGRTDRRARARLQPRRQPPSQRPHDRRQRRSGASRRASRLAGLAAERIDLRAHRGLHPRIGALDVLPFVPLAGASLADAAALAHRAGAGASGIATGFPRFITAPRRATSTAGNCRRCAAASSKDSRRVSPIRYGRPTWATSPGTKAPAR